MSDSHSEIQRSLGRIEGLQGEILFRVATMEDSVKTLHPRLEALESAHKQVKMFGKYGFTGIAIIALAYLPEPIRKFILALMP